MFSSSCCLCFADLYFSGCHGIRLTGWKSLFRAEKGGWDGISDQWPWGQWLDMWVRVFILTHCEFPCKCIWKKKTGVNGCRAERIQNYESEKNLISQWWKQTAALVLSAGAGRLPHINSHINNSLLLQFFWEKIFWPFCLQPLHFS